MRRRAAIERIRLSLCGSILGLSIAGMIGFHESWTAAAIGFAATWFLLPRLK
jgi:hypothetical protein